MAKFFIGLAAGIGIAYLAYRARSLSSSGGIAAAVLGTIVFGLGGVGWAVVLLTFFISSSALSKIFRQRKRAVDQNFAKGSRRDAGQVAANGGASGVLALSWFLLQQFHPGHPLSTSLWLGFCASLAAANADTWATELGILNPHQPVLLTTFSRVPRGTSGGVTLVGTLASLVGAGVVAGMAGLSDLAGWSPPGGPSLAGQVLLITAAGVTGALMDSFLGATLQCIYYCPACQKETERHPTHTCGAATTRKRGWGWLNNDWVNTACTVSAALLSFLGSLLI